MKRYEGISLSLLGNLIIILGTPFKTQAIQSLHPLLRQKFPSFASTGTQLFVLVAQSLDPLSQPHVCFVFDWDSHMAVSLFVLDQLLEVIVPRSIAIVFWEYVELEAQFGEFVKLLHDLGGTEC